MTNDSAPICTCCQDESKTSLTNTNEYGWLCDQCVNDINNESFDEIVNICESLKPVSNLI